MKIYAICLILAIILYSLAYNKLTKSIDTIIQSPNCKIIYTNLDNMSVEPIIQRLELEEEYFKYCK